MTKSECNALNDAICIALELYFTHFLDRDPGERDRLLALLRKLGLSADHLANVDRCIEQGLAMQCATIARAAGAATLH